MIGSPDLFFWMPCVLNSGLLLYKSSPGLNPAACESIVFTGCTAAVATGLTIVLARQIFA
ncbi:hypothetical protein BOTBODRAFT_521390 [Botryobasidium botryosum FD-172 SS1]|uniref:Uncharacterized protein n=1 Tax=Botryobasidium botryosum (strain FD-172 SS1) TaxID=930990 RepID=A0A067M2G9_BOTB1|nr:hypothetical protein BOTBODRAFT_521390 [Botryobasidium botryosum FD-172 SS1]